MSNSHTKFGWISSNGLGGDSITDGRTDGRTDGGNNNMPFAFKKKGGDKYALNLTLNEPITTAANDNFCDIYIGNKSWYFMWIVHQKFSWNVKMKSELCHCTVLVFRPEATIQALQARCTDVRLYTLRKTGTRTTKSPRALALLNSPLYWFNFEGSSEVDIFASFLLFKIYLISKLTPFWGLDNLTITNMGLNQT